MHLLSDTFITYNQPNMPIEYLSHVCENGLQKHQASDQRYSALSFDVIPSLGFLKVGDVETGEVEVVDGHSNNLPRLSSRKR